jgi:hypothetical protein
MDTFYKFIFGVVAFVALLFVVNNSFADETVKQKPRIEVAPKILSYQFNENVMISISNIECPFPDQVKEYPWAAVAIRVDGQKMVGCYKPLDENMLRIIWKGGDFSDIPANAFLVSPDGKAQKPKPILKRELEV